MYVALLYATLEVHLNATGADDSESGGVGNSDPRTE